MLTFDTVTRRSSRREVAATQEPEALKQAARVARLERRRAAKLLGVPSREVAGGLYYFAEDISAIEAAYRRGDKAGRAAVLALINRQHEESYGAGCDDGACSRRWPA